MIFEFLLASMILELTPGPNMAWLALLGTSRGRIAALAAVAGITLGLAFAATASILGVSALIATQPWIFNILRYTGFFYLIYLAWDAVRITNPKHKKLYDKSLPRYFEQGLLTNLLNPKAYLIYTTIIPQFTDSTHPLITQLTILSAIYVGVATLIHLIIAVLSGGLVGFFTNPRKTEFLGQFFAILLIFVAIWFLYATRMKL